MGFVRQFQLIVFGKVEQANLDVRTQGICYIIPLKKIFVRSYIYQVFKTVPRFYRCSGFKIVVWLKPIGTFEKLACLDMRTIFYA